jgi:XTP/dITP diphosphohydrolase
MQLLIATKNMHKLQEIRSILDISGLDLRGMDDMPGLPDVEEDGQTFEANAGKKARELAEHTGLWAMADDSGLEVDALGGAPGVYSARYAGEPVDYRRNNEKLLRELAIARNRTARFRCVIALAEPRGEIRTVEGRCEGRIASEARGDRGFGYDPLFVPDGYEVTFAEMPAEVKNRISHRGAALRRAVEAWRDLLGR